MRTLIIAAALLVTGCGAAAVQDSTPEENAYVENWVGSVDPCPTPAETHSPNFDRLTPEQQRLIVTCRN